MVTRGPVSREEESYSYLFKEQSDTEPASGLKNWKKN
jgi:hypothetical protein